MFCKHCGNELPDNANFCPNCGKFNLDSTQMSKPEEAPTPAPEPVRAPVRDIFEKERDELGGSILKNAIMALAFGATGLLPILGLIFHSIAKRLLNEYTRKFGETQGRATVGKHLCIPAIITSIIWTAFWTMYISILIIVVIAATA